MGFISLIGSSPHASACTPCARAISPPFAHGCELFGMFCALNGATRKPRRFRTRQIAAAVQLLPTWDAVPPTKIALAMRVLTYHSIRAPTRKLRDKLE